MTKTNFNEFSEQEFIAALQNGSHSSFQKIYNRFSPALYGTIKNWVKDTGTAENLLQDVFVKAWNNRHTYNPEKGRLFTWLYNISRHVCIDYYRSKQYKNGKALLSSEDISPLLPGQKMINYLPDAIGLGKLVDQLRYEEKQVVELMYFKGFTQKEIARVMQIPIGTVKTRMSMAIKNLRLVFMNDWMAAKQKLAIHN